MRPNCLFVSFTYKGNFESEERKRERNVLYSSRKTKNWFDCHWNVPILFVCLCAQHWSISAYRQLFQNDQSDLKCNVESAESPVASWNAWRFKKYHDEPDLNITSTYMPNWNKTRYCTVNNCFMLKELVCRKYLVYVLGCLIRVVYSNNFQVSKCSRCSRKFDRFLSILENC